MKVDVNLLDLEKLKCSDQRVFRKLNNSNIFSMQFQIINEVMDLFIFYNLFKSFQWNFIEL
jgi:hypothetical protein